MTVPASCTEISPVVHETGAYVTKNDLEQSIRSNKTAEIVANYMRRSIVVINFVPVYAVFFETLTIKRLQCVQ